ncbi:unnamed protein product [Gongylonema pulchrum]|uniref:Sec23_trunk domain-containing protein n=1 Tax=Gongylonema pulchrum TaxID=637853 RepID=A0A183EJ28_9BILA|nr:unnamed protein product [Gongylonema pulchrum]
MPQIVMTGHGCCDVADDEYQTIAVTVSLDMSGCLIRNRSISVVDLVDEDTGQRSAAGKGGQLGRLNEEAHYGTAVPWQELKRLRMYYYCHSRYRESADALLDADALIRISRFEVHVADVAQTMLQKLPPPPSDQHHRYQLLSSSS